MNYENRPINIQLHTVEFRGPQFVGDFSDAQLIAELIRRGRLKEYQATLKSNAEEMAFTKDARGLQARLWDMLSHQMAAGLAKSDFWETQMRYDYCINANEYKMSGFILVPK